MTLLIILLCIALNGVLAALEAAFISTSKADIKSQTREDDVRVKRFLQLRDTPERALSTIQLGITLVSIASGAVGGLEAQRFVAPFFESRFGLSSGGAQALAVAAVALPLMVVTVVAGELVPKVLALRHPEHIALIGARWLYGFQQGFLPVVGMLGWITKAIVSRIPRGPFATAWQGASAPRHYALDLLDLAKRRVRDAMVPWSQTTTADISSPPKSLAEVVLSSGHTRLPIVKESEVIGVLHTKELLTFLAAGELDWRTLIRAAVEIGPDDPLLRTLQLLQARRSHMAIVTGPDHIPLGIVTLEDILEEVLGDLYDEDDDRAVERLLAGRGKLRAANFDIGLRHHR